LQANAKKLKQMILNEAYISMRQFM